MKKIDYFPHWTLLCIFALFINLSPSNLYATSTLSDIDLELNISSENAYYTVFTHNTFTLTLQNTGASEATGVTVYIPFPSSQVAFTSSNASTGDYHLFSNTWNVGTLAPGATATLELKLFVLNTSNDITLFAQVQTANEADADSVPGNDTDQSPDEDDEDAVTLPLASGIDLELTAEFSPEVTLAGQNVTLKMTVTNKGPAIAENITVAYGTVPLSSTNVTVTQGNITSTGWSIGTLASGETANIFYDGIADVFTEPIEFFAQIQTATPGDVDSTPGNDFDQTPNEDDEALAVLSPDIAIEPEADLRFVVTSGEVVEEGDIVTLTVNLINEGPGDATAINVIELIPSELTILNVTATGIDAYNNNAWYIDELASGDGATLKLTVEVGALSGPISYFAQVQSVDQDDPDSTPGNNTTGTPNEDDEVEIELIPAPTPQADLELTAAFDVGTAELGDFVNITVEITNKGPLTATNIVVSDDLPSALAIAAPTVSKGTYNSDWEIPELASGESATVIFNGLVEVFEDPIIYFAQVQGVDQGDPDSTPGSDTAQLPIEDDEALAILSVIPPPMADLELTAKFDTEIGFPGSPYTLRVRITNNGPGDATDVVVSDEFPITFLSMQFETVSKGIYNGDWIIGDLASGEIAELIFDGTVNLFTEPIEYFAQVQTASPDDPDSTPGNDTDQTPDEDDEAMAILQPFVEDADLRFIVASGEVVEEGDIVTLTVNLINEGPGDATAINVVESIPSELTILNVTATGIDAYNNNTWYIDELASGEGATLEITVEVGALTRPIFYFAQVQSVDQDDPDSTPGNNTTGVPNEDDEVVIDLTPASTGTDIDLELNMTADVSEFHLYENVTYTIEVTNNGPANASGVQVAATVPTGMAFTSKSESKGFFNLWAGVWTVGDLASGETATLEIVTFTLNNSSSITNFAQVKAAQQDDSDSAPNNNNTNIPVEDDEAAVTIIPAGSVDNKIDLALSKSASVSMAKAGDDITYTLVVVNNGTAMATGVTVEDLLPSNLTFTGSTASKGSYDETTGIWDVTMLSIGGSATLNIHATVDVIVLPTTNFAQVKTANEEDVDSTPDNNSTTTPNEDDEDSVTILPDNSSEFCDIELTTEFTGPGEPGGSGTLFINIVNNGPADATDVTVKYDLPNQYFSSTYEILSQGTLNGEGWAVGDLASGQTAQIIYEGIVQLTTEPVVFFAQVQTASPQDSDSTPGNDTDQTPDEDDEAKLTFFPNDGGTKIDLEANMASSHPELSIYTNITFTLVVTNNSGVPASGVLAEFPIPSGMAFTSKAVSQGSYNLWSKVWTIGDLLPNETATLDLTLFVLNESADKNFYAEVIGANEDDLDSTPNNGTYPTPNEDDEAAVTVVANGSGSGGGKNDLESNIIGKNRLLTIHRMFPVPTQNTVNLLFSSEAEMIDLTLYDYTGRLLHRQTLEVLPDVNTTQMDLSEFPAGVYYISMETEEGNVRAKVVKQ